MKLKLILLTLIVIIKFSVIELFEEVLIEVSIKEEEQNGTIIVDLRSYIKSFSLLNNSNSYKIKFVRPCSNFYIDDKNLFEIRSLKLDREEICQYETNCYLNCDLFIEKEEIKLIKLRINIEDINDHKPKFKKSFYSYEFDENLSTGFRFQLEQAEDKDISEENSIKNYYLNRINSSFFPFKLHYDKENHLLELILMENIKTNRRVQYIFELVVVDGKNENDKCLIEINILNNEQNDYLPPRLEKNLYEFYISNQNQTFIGQIHAENPSNINNKQIYYRLIPSVENSNLFRINETTGEIFLNENQKLNTFDQFYEIFIEAFYFNSLSSLTTVQIHFNFTDSFSNNERESFIQILIPKLFQRDQNQSQIFLRENLSVPLTILQLFVSSSSLKPFIEMKTSMDENYFYLKQLDQQLFEFILLKPLDYELIQKIYLDFILNRQNLTKKSLEIIIENINDCQPIFYQTNFDFQIQENNQKPFLLYTFQAFDQDNLNQIVYQIQTSGSDYFCFLFVFHSLDFEMFEEYLIYLMIVILSKTLC